MHLLQEHAQTLQLQLCEVFVVDFETLAKEEHGVSEVGARIRMLSARVRMLQGGLVIIALNPHLKQPSRAFISTDEEVRLNWFVTGAMGFPSKREYSLAEFVVALLLEVDFGLFVGEDKATAREAEQAIAHAKEVQQTALSYLAASHAHWCHKLVESLRSNPRSFFGSED